MKYTQKKTKKKLYGKQFHKLIKNQVIKMTTQMSANNSFRKSKNVKKKVQFSSHRQNKKFPNLKKLF